MCYVRQDKWGKEAKKDCVGLEKGQTLFSFTQHLSHSFLNHKPPRLNLPFLSRLGPLIMNAISQVGRLYPFGS